MKFSLRRPRSPLMIALFLSFVLLAGLFMGWISGHVISDDNAFRSLTDNIFREEVSGSMPILKRNKFPALLPLSEQFLPTWTVHIRNMNSIFRS